MPFRHTTTTPPQEKVTQNGFTAIGWLILIVLIAVGVSGALVLFLRTNLTSTQSNLVTSDPTFQALTKNVLELTRTVEEFSGSVLTSTQITSQTENNLDPDQISVTNPSLSVGGSVAITKIVSQLKAGAGIEINADTTTSTISNSDVGSSQQIFKKVAVANQDTITAGSNDEELSIIAGSNISLSTDNDEKSLTISANLPSVNIDYTQGGWTSAGDVLALTNSSYSLGIGTTDAREKLTVAGGNILIGAQAAEAGSWSKISQSTPGSVAAGGTANIETIRSMAVYNGSLYAGTQEGTSAEIYRWDGGTNWTRVSFGTGQISSSGVATVDSVNKLTAYNGQLFAATARTNQSELLVYQGGTDWTRVNSQAGNFVDAGTISINEIESLVVYNGALYFGTTESNSAEIYRYDGSAITKVSDSVAGTIASGGTSSIDSVSALAVYNGTLYAGTNETAAAEVYRYDGGTTWTKISQSAGTISEAAGANSSVKGVRNMAVYNGSLYVGTEDDGDAEIYRYNGGTSWTAIGTGTPGVFVSGGEQYDKVHAMAIYHGQLYIGMDDPADAVVYRYEGGSTWSLVTDTEAGTITPGGTTEITEIRSLTVYNDTLIAGTAKTNAAEIYQYHESSGQSYALKFASTNSQLAAQPGYSQDASISFLGDQQANSNRGNDAAGQFIFSHGLTTATGAYDVAEDYPTRETDLVVGELLAIDPGEPGFVKRATSADKTKIVGVYSGNPALRLSQKESSGTKMVAVALVGRVPVKIEQGSSPIKAGDHLAASQTPGQAAKAKLYSYTIGKALESWDCTEPNSTICKEEIMISVQQGLWIGSLSDSGQIIGEVTPNTTQLTDGNDRLEPLPLPDDLLKLHQKVALLEDTIASMTASLTTLASGSAELQSVEGVGDTTFPVETLADWIELNQGEHRINFRSLDLTGLHIFDGRLEISANGDLRLNSGRLMGNDLIRGSEIVTASASSIRVERGWDSPPVSITATPQWDAYVWITDISEAGFIIHFSQAPSESGHIFWQAWW